MDQQRYKHWTGIKWQWEYRTICGAQYDHCTGSSHHHGNANLYQWGDTQHLRPHPLYTQKPIRSSLQQYTLK